jgi:hypothetical protein
MNKPIIIYESRWLRWMPWNSWVYGQVLYPLMLFKKKKGEVSEKTFRHELQHFYQGQELGFFKYYIRYIYWWFKYGYDKHPMELEAQRFEDTPLTAQERKWYSE